MCVSGEARALLVELRARPDRLPLFTVAGAVALELTAVPDVHVGSGKKLFFFFNNFKINTLYGSYLRGL